MYKSVHVTHLCNLAPRVNSLCGLSRSWYSLRFIQSQIRETWTITRPAGNATSNGTLTRSTRAQRNGQPRYIFNMVITIVRVTTIFPFPPEPTSCPLPASLLPTHICYRALNAPRREWSLFNWIHIFQSTSRRNGTVPFRRLFYRTWLFLQLITDRGTYKAVKCVTKV